MTRFFFDTGDKGDLMRDVTGLELPNVEAARLEAIKALPGIACELLVRIAIGGETSLRTYEIGRDAGYLQHT